MKCLVLALLVFLCVVPSSYAQTTNTDAKRPLVGHVMHYYTNIYQASMTRAVAQINSAHVGLTLIRMTSPAGADLVIRGSNGYDCRNGWAGSEDGLKISVAKNCLPRGADILIAHELGHAIGLDHTTSFCTVMNPFFHNYPSPHPDHCRATNSWYRKPYITADLRGIAKLWKTDTGPVINYADTEWNINTNDSLLLGGSVTDEHLTQVAINWGNGHTTLWTGDAQSLPLDFQQSPVSYDTSGDYTVQVDAWDQAGLHTTQKYTLTVW